MSTVHEILCKLSLEGDHATPPSAYGSVKAYTNFDVERDALNIETPIKTKRSRMAAPRSQLTVLHNQLVANSPLVPIPGRMTLALPTPPAPSLV
uniref:Uncharacterized protein n=1 Tax=Phocoena sinus TaxID=42100 RepID=A0A8C9BAL4_PHOSS